MKRLVLILLTTLLYISQPVAVVQMDIDTEGTATSLVEGKTVSQNRLPNGKLRVVLFGLNQDVFEGACIEISKDVSGIENVVAANPDAEEVEVLIEYVNAPKDLKKGTQ